jgi:hypothetical protein
MTVSGSARPAGCPSDFVLDQLVAGDLAGAPAEIIARRHVADCTRCSARLAAFQAVEVPPFSELGARSSEGPRLRLKSFVITLAAAALAGGIALYAASKSGEAPRAALEVTRAKGALALSVIVRRESGEVTRLAPLGAVHPGDSLRFELASAEPGFAAVLGVDAAGAVTPYVPACGALRSLAGGPPVALDETIVADDTLGTERLVAVVCREPMPVAELVSSASRALAAASGDPTRVSNLHPGCAEARFDIQKRTDGAR